jgi:hypothetical protein
MMAEYQSLLGKVSPTNGSLTAGEQQLASRYQGNARAAGSRQAIMDPTAGGKFRVAGEAPPLNAGSVLTGEPFVAQVTRKFGSYQEPNTMMKTAYVQGREAALVQFGLMKVAEGEMPPGAAGPEAGGAPQMSEQELEQILAQMSPEELQQLVGSVPQEQMAPAVGGLPEPELEAALSQLPPEQLQQLLTALQNIAGGGAQAGGPPAGGPQMGPPGAEMGAEAGPEGAELGAEMGPPGAGPKGPPKGGKPGKPGKSEKKDEKGEKGKGKEKPEKKESKKEKPEMEEKVASAFAMGQLHGEAIVDHLTKTAGPMFAGAVQATRGGLARGAASAAGGALLGGAAGAIGADEGQGGRGFMRGALAGGLVGGVGGTLANKSLRGQLAQGVKQVGRHGDLDEMALKTLMSKRQMATAGGLAAGTLAAGGMAGSTAQDNSMMGRGKRMLSGMGIGG